MTPTGPPSIFQWLVAEFVVALVPTVLYMAVLAAGLDKADFAKAVKSAAPVYIPCSIYLGVCVDIILTRIFPGFYRLLLCPIVFTITVGVMAVGLGYRNDPDFVPPWHWYGLQLFVIVSLLCHAAFEKCVLENSKQSCSITDCKLRI